MDRAYVEGASASCRSVELVPLVAGRSITGVLQIHTAWIPSTCYNRGRSQAFDRWIEKGGAVYLDEPLGLDIEFRELTNQFIPAPKELSDSYLAAFATAASLNLVTFDKALSRKARRSVLLATSVEEPH
jgi:hypothetical protein